jgi:prepilin-type processing-associated H-X9-DG protein
MRPVWEARCSKLATPSSELSLIAVEVASNFGAKTPFRIGGCVGGVIRNPKSESDIYSPSDGTGHSYAFHTGGTNALFGDGLVRFLGSSTNMGMLAALVTRAAGEAVSGDF